MLRFLFRLGRTRANGKVDTAHLVRDRGVDGVCGTRVSETKARW